MRSELCLALLLCACAGEVEPFVGIGCELDSTGLNEVSFDAERMICVQIDMDEADFEDLSLQQRFGETEHEQWPGVIAYTATSCSKPYPDPYTWFAADISVDDLSAQDVGVRKKGFLGSVEYAGDRPSLKVKTDAFDSDRALGDTEDVVLNNNNQDTSRVRTCLAYSVFADAGYPAPLCNLANVSVNGHWKGAYTHVEAPKKAFLRRAFGNDEGSLYEGAVADFTDPHLAGLPANLGRFEAKTDDTRADGAGLRRIADALQRPDDALETALAEVLDLDAFFRFWALETVIGHVDGYNENTNNFYVYFDPDRGGRAVFIPWGPDDTFWAHTPGFVTSELGRRLSRHPVLGPRYLVELERVLDEVWDEDRLTGRVDRWSELVVTAEQDHQSLDWSVDQLHDWIERRDARMRGFIAEGGGRGGAQTRPCTGNREPSDFLALGEVTTIASVGCQTAPGVPGWAAWLVALVAVRRSAGPQTEVRRPGPQTGVRP